MVNTNQTHSASGDNVGQDKNTFNQSGKIGIGDNQGIISGNAKIAGQYNEAPKVNVNVHVNVGEGNNNNGKCDQPSIIEKSTVLEKVEAFLILTGTLSADNPIELDKQKRKIKAVIEHLNKEFDLDLSIDVRNARFNYCIGIDENMKQDLIKRGAIFEDSPGDRSSVLVLR